MKRKSLIIGAGGHCRVVVSLLVARGDRDALGIIDLAEPRGGESIMGVAIIGSTGRLAEYRGRDDIDVFLAIGDNAVRRTWWQALRESGLAFPSLVSPQAIVDPTARLGEGTVVCARAFVGPDAVVGNNALLNTSCIVEHEVRIGDHCHLAPSSTVAGRSRIGDGCFIGAGATVIDRITIAADVTVGAGATVVRDIDATGGVYVGVPARKRAAGVNTA